MARALAIGLGYTSPSGEEAMDVANLLATAVALSMDAMAVSIATGIQLGKPGFRPIFRLAFHFGLFQAGMPVLGWLAGTTIRSLVSSWDHWVAFGLLAFIGGKMIVESMKRAEAGECGSRDPTRGFSLVLLSVATSIDAFAVGMSFALIETSIWIPCLVIGLTTGGLSALGGAFGCKLGMRFGKRMELLGGVVLVAIGARILMQHVLAA
jgi:putative Mn2+ efflux pump MntP